MLVEAISPGFLQYMVVIYAKIGAHENVARKSFKDHNSQSTESQLRKMFGFSFEVRSFRMTGSTMEMCLIQERETDLALNLLCRILVFFLTLSSISIYPVPIART